LFKTIKKSIQRSNQLTGPATLKAQVRWVES